MTEIYKLDRREFKRLSTFIQDKYGIKMPEVKKTLLESRLQKRLKLLELNSFKKYCDYLFSKNGLERELPYFIDKITTNKTDFFRENEHFEFLTTRILTQLLRNHKRGDTLRVWSAGCSTGEEPYTLAMVISDFLDNNGFNSVKLSVLATDVSNEVLQTAQKAIYHESRAVPIPFALKKKYLLKSTARDLKLIKIAPEIRGLVTFARLNFMDDNYSMNINFDIIFCRNVIIYFDKKTQEEILKKIISYLTPGGYFFQGHSESMQGLALPIKQILPTVYMKN